MDTSATSAFDFPVGDLVPLNSQALSIHYQDPLPRRVPDYRRHPANSSGSTDPAVRLPVNAMVSPAAPASASNAAARFPVDTPAASTATLGLMISPANQRSPISDEASEGNSDSTSAVSASVQSVFCDKKYSNYSSVYPKPLPSLFSPSPERSATQFLTRLASQITVPPKPPVSLTDNLLNLKPFTRRFAPTLPVVSTKRPSGQRPRETPAFTRPSRVSQSTPTSSREPSAAAPNTRCLTIHNNPYHYFFNYRSISDSYFCLTCCFNQTEYQLRVIHKNLASPFITYICHKCSRSNTFYPKLPGECPGCL